MMPVSGHLDNTTFTSAAPSVYSSAVLSGLISQLVLCSMSIALMSPLPASEPNGLQLKY
jgi:hypothetical protein